jgi:peptidoglycan/LPS O-acetylase OafA/YrhL
MLSHYRVDSILWGAVAALLFDRAGSTGARRLALAAAWGATLLFIGKGWLSPQPTVVGHSLGLTLLAIAVALTVVETVAVGTSRRWVRLLEWAPLRETGRISYEIYLLHLPAMDVGRALFLGERAIVPTLPAFLLAFAGSSALSFGFGWVAHRFVGRPALRLKSRLR